MKRRECGETGKLRVLACCRYMHDSCTPQSSQRQSSGDSYLGFQQIRRVRAFWIMEWSALKGNGSNNHTVSSYLFISSKLGSPIRSAENLKLCASEGPSQHPFHTDWSDAKYAPSIDWIKNQYTWFISCASWNLLQYRKDGWHPLLRITRQNDSSQNVLDSCVIQATLGLFQCGACLMVDFRALFSGNTPRFTNARLLRLGQPFCTFYEQEIFLKHTLGRKMLST